MSEKAEAMVVVDQTAAPKPDHLSVAAGIVATYVANNKIPDGELPALILATYRCLAQIERKVSAPVTVSLMQLEPAVSIAESVTDDYIICLEDGKRFKALKRHIANSHSMTPEGYRSKWSLPSDYPMVAPTFARVRADLAKQIGLGYGGAKTSSAKGSKSKAV